MKGWVETHLPARTLSIEHELIVCGMLSTGRRVSWKAVDRDRVTAIRIKRLVRSVIRNAHSRAH